MKDTCIDTSFGFDDGTFLKVVRSTKNKKCVSCYFKDNACRFSVGEAVEECEYGCCTPEKRRDDNHVYYQEVSK